MSDVSTWTKWGKNIPIRGTKEGEGEGLGEAGQDAQHHMDGVKLEFWVLEEARDMRDGSEESSRGQTMSHLILKNLNFVLQVVGEDEGQGAQCPL